MPTDPTQADNSTQALKPLAVWRPGFLMALRINANVSAAARAVGVNRQHCYDCRTNDPSFAAEWQEALEEAVDNLEERAWKRALFTEVQYKFQKDGSPLYHPVTNEPYFEHVGSDTVLLRLLQAHRPDKYKERSEQQHTGAVALNATLEVLHTGVPLAGSEKEVDGV